jgi:L-cysteine:1D-myo-inositol 2-amino-2-deoxy-alpha-D-glucopyranoside ligase
VTDVDDPLFARATRDGVDWRELAEENLTRYVEDSAALNMVVPNFFPRASTEIPGMIGIIERLIAGGYAYVREGNVYFRIASDPDFGAMARMGYAEMLELANERGNTPDDPRKDDPLDFVLWQRGEPGDPTWDSPWGPGRPGWHIECSAMATRYLGNQIDIHGGGADLLFPHHSCEIAQTELATGERPFARFWLHAGLVWLDGAKMSKSLGNLVFVRDALEEHDADTLRWYLLDKHYREEFNYEPAKVAEAREPVEKLRAALALTGGTGPELSLREAKNAFDGVLGDDLNTPDALEALRIATRYVHAAAAEERDIRAAQRTLQEMANVLGLLPVVS